MKDYINDTFIRLTDEGRVKDAVAFCERLAEEAPYVEFRCIALKNLAECHFFMTGDGEACREANLRGLRLMEENEEILEGTERMPKKMVQRMYSDFCEQFRSVAVSFDEYEEYCEKPLRVREQNATEKRGLRAVADLKSKNAGWIENMFILLDRYFPQSQWGGRAPAAAQAACLAQLILSNRRTLRAKPLDVNFGLQQYQNAIVASVENLMANAEKHRCRPVAEQLLFMIDRAAALIETFRNDRQADHPSVEKCLENLTNFRAHVNGACLHEGVQQGAGYLTMADLEKEFDGQMEVLKNTRLTGVDTGQNRDETIGGPPQPGRRGNCGCAVLLLAVIIVVAILIWKLHLFGIGA